ncbi:MAG: hypothetical protein U5L96_14690 [Owenweeksia sp.]|nr:hypothetical protein [Owenweeksia sp.]
MADINPQVPRSHGEGMIHSSIIDYAVKVDQPDIRTTYKAPTETEQKMANILPA